MRTLVCLLSKMHYAYYTGHSESSDLEVIKFEYSLKLKIKRNDWLLADTCLQADNHCALF